MSYWMELQGFVTNVRLLHFSTDPTKQIWVLFGSDLNVQFYIMRYFI